MKENNNTVSDKELRDEERISAYMRGEMSKEEETTFLEELKADEGLRSKAVDLAYLAKGMKEVGEQRDEDVKEALLSTNSDGAKTIASKVIGDKNDMSGSQQQQRILEYANYELSQEDIKEAEIRSHFKAFEKRRTIRQQIVRLMSSAACIAVLCVGGFKYYDYRTVTGLGEQYGTEFASGQFVSRGASKDVEDEKIAKELSALYSNVQEGKDLDATIKRLSVLWEVSTLDTYNDYTEDAPLIGWNLAIAELKNYDKDAAKVVLNKLVSISDSSAINMKAKELLNKLN